MLVLRLEELGRARLDEPDAQVDGEDLPRRSSAVGLLAWSRAGHNPLTPISLVCRLLHVVATPPFKNGSKSRPSFPTLRGARYLALE